MSQLIGKIKKNKGPEQKGLASPHRGSAALNKSSQTGCETCWPEEANEVPFASALKLEREIIDESHYRATVASCLRCGQHYIHLMTEEIDWSGGDDAIRLQRMPITNTEAAEFRALVETKAEARMYALGQDQRKCWVRDAPTGGPETTRFAKGLYPSPHD